jgi:hypothetical protein
MEKGVQRTSRSSTVVEKALAHFLAYSKEEMKKAGKMAWC